MPTTGAFPILTVIRAPLQRVIEFCVSPGLPRRNYGVVSIPMCLQEVCWEGPAIREAQLARATAPQALQDLVLRVHLKAQRDYVTARLIVVKEAVAVD